MIQSQPFTHILRNSARAVAAALATVALLAGPSRALAAELTWTNNNSDVWTSLTAWQTNLVDAYTNSASTNFYLGCVPDVNTIPSGHATNLVVCGAGGGGGFPAFADTAHFTNSSTYTVTINVTTNVSSVIFSNTAGVVTMGAGVNTLTVTGTFVVADGGATSTLYWSSGTLNMGIPGNSSLGHFDVAGNNTNSLAYFAVTNGTVGLGPLTQIGRSGAASFGTFVISGPGLVTNPVGETGSIQVRGDINQASQMIITNGGKLFINPPNGGVGFETFSNSTVLVSDPNSLLYVQYTTKDYALAIGNGSSVNFNTAPGCPMTVSNGATVHADGTITFGHGASWCTGVVVGAGSQLTAGSLLNINPSVNSTSGAVIVGSTSGANNALYVYNGGYISAAGTLEVPDTQSASNAFYMGGPGAMSTGIVVVAKMNSGAWTSLIQITNALFNCSEMSIEGTGTAVNALNVLAGGTLIISNQYLIDQLPLSTGEIETNVLEIGATGTITGNNSLMINGGTVSVVSGTNAFEMHIGGGSYSYSGSSMIITNGGKLLSELGTIGPGSSYNTGVVVGVGSVWSNWTSYAVTTNRIVIGGGPTNSTSGYNYLGVLSGAGLYNNGQLSIGVTNPAPFNTAVFGGVGPLSTIVNTYNIDIGEEGQTYGNTLVVSNATVTCGGLNVGGPGATNNLLSFSGGTITVNGNMTVMATNTVTFAAGVLSAGSMYCDPTANGGNAFVVGDGVHAAIYAMNPYDTGYHTFGSGLMITNDATLEGNGTLVSNVTVLGTFSPGFGAGGSVYVSNNLAFGTLATLDYDLGTLSDSATVSGALTLNGSINVANSGGLASGNYVIFTYGSLVNNGLIVNSMPPGFSVTVSNNAAANQILLVVTGTSTPFGAWQTEYFSSGSLNSQAGGSVDRYGTGMSNTNKFMTGFAGNLPSAYLHIISTVKSSGNINVTYLGASGDTNYLPGVQWRTNVLEYTTGTANGSFVNSSWTPTGQTNVLGVGLTYDNSGGTGAGTKTNMTDVGGASATPSRYYRVRVLLP